MYLVQVSQLIVALYIVKLVKHSFNITSMLIVVYLFSFVYSLLVSVLLVSTTLEEKRPFSIFG